VVGWKMDAGPHHVPIRSVFHQSRPDFLFLSAETRGDKRREGVGTKKRGKRGKQRADDQDKARVARREGPVGHHPHLSSGPAWLGGMFVSLLKFAFCYCFLFFFFYFLYFFVKLNKNFRCPSANCGCARWAWAQLGKCADTFPLHIHIYIYLIIY
jgi:hypothetical protein